MSTRSTCLSVFLAVCAVTGLVGAAMAQPVADPSAQGVAQSARDVRYVVVHRPGPNWLAGKGMFEQPGLRDHVAHYQKLLDAGKLALGGPYLDANGGGMMIPEKGMSQAEITQFAAEDPAVRSGLLLAEVRPWLIGLRP